MWYPPLLGILAALDNFLVVIPTDGILISSSMLRPKRWFIFATAVAIGSTVGASCLAGLVEHQGLPYILQFFPGINESATWLWAESFMDRAGLLLVFLVAITPLPQQPTVILASLAHTPLAYLAVAVFAGRYLKFILMSYLASHAPSVLTRLWGVKGEMKEVGLQVSNIGNDSRTITVTTPNKNEPQATSIKANPNG